jgi:hypothetical protein
MRAVTLACCLLVSAGCDVDVTWDRGPPTHSACVVGDLYPGLRCSDGDVYFVNGQECGECDPRGGLCLAVPRGKGAIVGWCDVQLGS